MEPVGEGQTAFSLWSELLDYPRAFGLNKRENHLSEQANAAVLWEGTRAEGAAQYCEGRGEKWN